MNITRRHLICACLAAAVAFAAYWLVTEKPIYRFPGLSGPSKSTTIAPPSAVRIADYSQGAASRLAILVTDPDSDWLGLVHGMQSIGIPFIVTQKYEEALKHNVVLAYPMISGKVLGKEALQALAAHPRNGGTLIGFEILGGGLNETFGFADTAASRTHKELRIDDAAAQSLMLSEKEDRTIPLSGPSGSMAAYAFTPTSGTAVAHYDSGEAAIVRRDVGNGHTYAIGIDIGAYLAKAYNGRQDFGKIYINGYEPAVDILLRMMRQVYRDAEPLAVTIDTVPDGKSAAVIFTHDIDYTKSLENAIRYAEYEKSQGIKATYFIQTKYVRDWNDDIFFNDRGAVLTRTLSSLGMEIASHSVSHSRVFSTFPIGDGSEQYPAYVPFVKSKTDTRNGTILGELRVSRFLLENAVPGLTVKSFRPGHLQYPFALPQAMQATDYLFSSSVSSGTATSHLPFRLTYDRANKAETKIFEFPITIEDELQRPMTARLPAAMDILKKMRAYGGVLVVLIHPDVFDDKFAFLQGLVTQAKETNAWFGTLGQFGTWWAARDRTTVDAQRNGGDITLELKIPLEASGLSIQIPKGWKLTGSEGTAGKARQEVDKVQITGADGKMILHFRTGGG